MKNNLIRKYALPLIVLLCLFASKPIQAQCPYTISNNLGCAVKVNITIYSLPPAACTAVCFSQSGVLVPAGSILPILCGGCTPCNIVVTVTHMAGTPVTPSNANFSTTTSPGNPLNFIGPPCTPPLTTAYILYDAGGTVFKIYK